VFPEGLLEPDGPPEHGPGVWWVLHTRPRAEKSLARQLRSREQSFFLPLYRHHWRKQGRNFTSYLPLFPGYVFLHGDARTDLTQRDLAHVARVLPVVEQGHLRDDLCDVYRLVRSGSGVSPEDRLTPGTAVEIVNGPLTGLRGKILRRGSQLRVYVEVRFLQQRVSVEVESWMVEPLSVLHPNRPEGSAPFAAGARRAQTQSVGP
jgi:transcriptional antiterminator RfaH